MGAASQDGTAASALRRSITWRARRHRPAGAREFPPRAEGPRASPDDLVGYLANDVHFENPDARGQDASPRYATIYDIVSPDPATAWPDTERSPAYPTHLFSDPRARLVAPVLRASYALAGAQLRPGPHGPLTGVHVILSDGGDDTERQHREAQILQTGTFYSAARFRIIEGSPEPAGWLEIFETDDPDPLRAYQRATSHTPPAPQIQPRLSESFRLLGTTAEDHGPFGKKRTLT